MIKDITIGQYFPGESVVHRIDPRMKIILTIAYIVLLFITGNIAGFVIPIAFVIAMYKIAGIPFSFIAKSVKPILPLILFTSLVNLFFINGDVIFRFYFITITAQGVQTAVFMAVRILCLIIGTSLLTYTTSPIVLTDGIEQLLSPLAKLKLPVHELAMMMTIALRFIPTLIEETDKIMSAQKARGAKLDSGSFAERVKALIPVLIPLFVSAFRRAAELALAMECRCYRGGEGRTKLNTLKFHMRDCWAAFVMAAAFVCVICVNIASAEYLVNWI